MTLKEAMIEAVLLGNYWGESSGKNKNAEDDYPRNSNDIVRWNNHPRSKKDILYALSTYPVKFTRDQAEKEFDKFQAAGFIFQIKHRSKYFYPSYDEASLKKLRIKNDELAEYLTDRAQYRNLTIEKLGWRIYGVHLDYSRRWRLGPMPKKTLNEYLEKLRSMTLRQALIEATLYGNIQEERGYLCPHPITKGQILGWADTYYVKFTKTQAEKEFQDILKAGFIFQVKPFKNEKDKQTKYYPSYNPSTLRKLKIDDADLAADMATHLAELKGVKHWRTYGYSAEKHLSGEM